MIVYHGTTRRRAERICVEGFKPRKPSRRVWFAKGKGYARGRAQTQARRADDRMVILTCDLDLDKLRHQLGSRRVRYSAGIIAIDGTVPITVLRSHPAEGLVPTSPEELNLWVCRLLKIPKWKGPGQSHPGIERLSRWVVNRLNSEPNRQVQQSELVELAQRWLSEYFHGVVIDPDTLAVCQRGGEVHVKAAAFELPPDSREDEALDCLAEEAPSRRARGLTLLAELGDPDLFDWCAMYLGDTSQQVQLAALQTIAHHCEDAHAELLEPFAASGDKRLRAAAIAGLCRHAGAEAPRWFERGLKDICACVRLETATMLDRLDPTAHQPIFELALTDPNPKLVDAAKQLTAHKGYAPIRW